MVLLASTYDQSKYFKAADLAGEKKLKIKSVTEELVGMDKDKEKETCRLVHQRRTRFGSQSCRTTERSAAPSAMTSPAGPARSSSSFRRWRNSAARWRPRYACVSRRRSRPQPQHRRGNGATASPPPAAPPVAPVKLVDR